MQVITNGIGNQSRITGTGGVLAQLVVDKAQHPDIERVDIYYQTEGRSPDWKKAQTWTPKIGSHEQELVFSRYLQPDQSQGATAPQLAFVVQRKDGSQFAAQTYGLNHKIDQNLPYELIRQK